MTLLTMIVGISSMATRLLLNEMAAAYRQKCGTRVTFESMGGVDAAQRVQAGEPYDLAVLATDAIAKLISSGCILADSKTDLVRSPVVIAIRKGTPRPDISSEKALLDTVRAARTLGYSTGPSGTALLKLFERWGILDKLQERIVQAPPGIPVGKLVAEGKVELGFQQYSEMMDVPGVDIVGPMPAECAIFSTFTAGLCNTSRQPEAVRDLIAYMHSPGTADAKRRYGMEPA